MIDIISNRQEESGFGEGRGEAEGMLRCARVKLTQCRMDRIKERFNRVDHPQSDSESKSKEENLKEGIYRQDDQPRLRKILGDKT